MHVIGTAGHVDHGKSTLVQALTGTHPDRLKEEREREMTIDLGFAWFNLPGGEEVGIVDVPGHRDFIENMLAGIGGIDAALFVVAADEGVMPQTREHLAILDLLQIPGGVVALTKIDLMQDKDWLDLVEADLQETFAGTVLENAPVVRVSARSGEGIPGLLQALSACLSDKPPRPDYQRPRLPVDRVFTIAGFGTVVTGTLSDGRLKVGEDVVILPNGGRGRIRGLQTHRRKEDVAVPGSRTAINISGLTVDQVQRGEVVAHPGDYRPSRRLDVRFRLLPDASTPVKHNTEAKLFIGAAEVVARIRLLGSEELMPGQAGWLQLETSVPIVAMRGDRYILRRPSPGETLGGGKVVDPNPKGRHKRFSAEAIARLEAFAQGTPGEVLLQALIASRADTVKNIISRSSLEAASAEKAVRELASTGQMVNLENGSAEAEFAPNSLVMSKGTWEQTAAKIVQELTDYHSSSPLRLGMPREELKSRLRSIPRPSPRLFNAIVHKLASEAALEEAGPLVRLPGYTIRFSPQQDQAIENLMRRFTASPYSPPTVKECQAEVGEEVLAALLDLDKLVKTSPDVVFRKEDYEKMVSEIRQLSKQNQTITAAQVRDHFNTSRRYALALLEYLDASGISTREGDVHRLK